MTNCDQRGFTLMDTLVGLAVALVVGGGAVTFVRAQSLALRTQATQTDVNDQARGVVELMAREIRLAGLNPRCIVAPPPLSALIVAQPQRLRIQYDRNENGALDTSASASEDVTYQYNPETLVLQRVAGDTTSDLATGVPTNGFALKYFQSNGTEIIGTEAGNALTAAQMAAVYRISVKFEPVNAADTRLPTNARSTLWTSVLLRNVNYPCA